MFCMRMNVLVVLKFVAYILLFCDQADALDKARFDDNKPSFQTLTLGQSLEHALRRQPYIKLALARIHAREVEARVPRAQWTPQLTTGAELVVGTVNQTSASVFNIDKIEIARIAGRAPVRDADWNAYPSTFAVVGLQQQIFDFGRIAAQSAAHDARVSIESEAARSIQLDVAFNVEEAYFAVRTAKDVLRAAEGAYQRSKTHRDAAAAGVIAGLKPPIELARAEADLTRFDAGLKSARGGLTTARFILGAAIGEPQWEVDVPDQKPPFSANLPFVMALNKALKKNPELRAALLTVRSQALETKAVAKEMSPDLFLSAVGYGYAGGAPTDGGPNARGGGWIPNVPNYAAGVLFSFPIIDAPVRARQSASQAKEHAARAAADVAKQALIASVRSAWIALDVACETLPALRQAVAAAQANHAQAEARFMNGLGTSVELADAEQLRIAAEIRYALGEFDVWRARAALGRLLAERS